MVTVITGATKGIGRALAFKFAAEGHSLAVCARNSDDLNELSGELLAKNKDIRVFTKSVDISIKQDVQQFAMDIIREFGAINVLINNGGIFIPGKVSEEDDGVYEMMMATNVDSAYHLTRALLPMMYNSEKPHIFNMCSIASFTAYPNGGTYTISKYALLGMTKSLRAELLDKGIKVTAIMPGATWTHSWEGADFPEDRLMQPEDIAESIWFAYSMATGAVVEEIIIRPQLGDL